MALSAKTRSLLGLVGLVLAVSAAQAWWQQRHRDHVGEEVAALAQGLAREMAPGRTGQSPIHMTSSDVCAVCDQARNWMTEHRVPFTECSIERDPQCRAAFEASRAPGTPVLRVGDSRAMLGFTPERLRSTLQQAQQAQQAQP